MQYGGAPGAYVGLNQPRDSQTGYHFASIVCGSKLFASSIDLRSARKTVNYSVSRIASELRRSTLRPIACASASNLSISVANSAGVSAWSASHQASRGQGCTSINNASAPAAIPAHDNAGTIHALPPACDGSTMTGRCVSFFTTATAVTSSTLRYA